MSRNPVTKAIADARNRCRVMPGKRQEGREEIAGGEAAAQLAAESPTTPGEQIAQCVDDMAFNILALAIGSEEHRKDRQEAYAAAKEKLAVLLDAAMPVSASTTNEKPAELFS